MTIALEEGEHFGGGEAAYASGNPRLSCWGLIGQSSFQVTDREVTNLAHSPRRLYEKIYCARGNIENRIKELHHGPEIDRTRCRRFLATQLRGLLSAAAYVLYQELRLRAARTAFRSAQVSTLREHLMKLGAWVQSSVRRIVLHRPATALHRQDWQIIAKNLGAAPA